MWYASFIQFGKIDTDTTDQKWLVVFLYAFLEKTLFSMIYTKMK